MVGGTNNISLQYSKNVPIMHSGPNGSIRFRHQEFVDTLVGSNKGLDSMIDLPLNAGVRKAFPYLSQIADRFQQFKFHGLAFEYRPTSGEGLAGSNPAIGQVTMSTNYDVYRPIPKQGERNLQLAEQYVNFGKPSLPLLHGIECKSKMLDLPFYRVKKTLNLADISQGDSRFYFMGNTQIRSSGIVVDDDPNHPAKTFPLGDVYVTYDVELTNPTITAIVNTLSTPMPVYKSFGQIGTLAPLVPSDDIVPLGDYSLPENPVVPQVNELGISHLYGDFLVEGGNLKPGVLNGWRFDNAPTDGLQYFEITLRYKGIAIPATFAMEGWSAFYGAMFVTNAYGPSPLLAREDSTMPTNGFITASNEETAFKFIVAVQRDPALPQDQHPVVYYTGFGAAPETIIPDWTGGAPADSYVDVSITVVNPLWFPSGVGQPVLAHFLPKLI